MLINPEYNIEIRDVLDELYDDLSFIAPEICEEGEFLNEYKWSIVLVYLLLKSLGDNSLSSLISSELPDFFEAYKILMNFTLQDENADEIIVMPPLVRKLYYEFFDDYKINPYILKRALHLMRLDIEMRILFAIFGGKYIQSESQDGTGAIYFSEGEYKSKSGEKKLEILKDHLESYENNKIPCIVLNLEDHWVPIISINEDIIYFNDPLSVDVSKIRIDEDFLECYRFYLFIYEPTSSILLNPPVRKFLKEEIKSEFENLQEFATNLIDKIESYEKVEESTQQEKELFTVALEEARSEVKACQESRKEAKIEVKPTQESKKEVKFEIKPHQGPEGDIIIPTQIKNTIHEKKSTISIEKVIPVKEIAVKKVKVPEIEEIKNFTKNLLENFEFQKKRSVEHGPSISNVLNAKSKVVEGQKIIEKEIIPVEQEIKENVSLIESEKIVEEKKSEKRFIKERQKKEEEKLKIQETKFYEKPKKEEGQKDHETMRKDAISDIQNFTKNILKKFEVKKKMVLEKDND